MGFIDPEIKKEADNLVKDKATNKLNARSIEKTSNSLMRKRLVALLVAIIQSRYFALSPQRQPLNLTDIK